MEFTEKQVRKVLENKSNEEILDMCRQLWESRQKIIPWWSHAQEYIEKGFIPRGSGI